MIELSVEEKAKRYDEAIKRLEDIKTGKCQKTFMFTEGLFDYIFPELKESEDERIRKELLQIAKECEDTFYMVMTPNKRKHLIAWLEKQGEKFQYWKPSKEQLKALDYAYNSCSDTERGNYYEGVLETLIDDLRKLSEKQGEQKPTIEMKSPEESLGIDSDTYNKIVDECIYGEQKPTDNIEPKFKVGQTIKKEGFNSGFSIVKIENGFYYNDMGDNFPFTDQDSWELVEQKPADWSEEDEDIIQALNACINAAIKSGMNYISFDSKSILIEKVKNWLKSLKERVQPQNRWKESLATADLENSLCDIQDGFSDTSYEYRALGEAIEFIRCTESKPQWKPSEEEIEALRKAEATIGVNHVVLAGLISDLEKLKG